MVQDILRVSPHHLQCILKVFCRGVPGIFELLKRHQVL